MAIENTVSSDFFIRVRQLLRAFSITAYPVWGPVFAPSQLNALTKSPVEPEMLTMQTLNRHILDGYQKRQVCSTPIRRQPERLLTIDEQSGDK